MPPSMIRSPFSWLWKSRPQHDVAVNDLAVALAFVEGFKYGLGPGGQALRQELLEEAAGQVLQGREPSIAARATAAGTVQARDVVALQAKQREFQERWERTRDPKYQHYLECLAWMLPPKEDVNGH